MTLKEQEAFAALKQELAAAKKRIRQQEKDLVALATRCAALSDAMTRKKKGSPHDR